MLYYNTFKRKKHFTGRLKMAKKLKESDLEKLAFLVRRKEKIKRMSEDLDDKIEKLVEKLGPCAHVVELNKATPDGEKFLRMKLVDNAEDFMSGKPIYRPAKLRRFEVSYSFLKREPKEEHIHKMPKAKKD